MRFVTYAGREGDRAGLLVSQEVYALPPGVRLVDLLGDLPAAGEAALRDPAEVVPLDAVRLRAPIPDPPTVRDFMTFEQHVEGVAKLMGAGVPEQWYAAPAFYFTNPYAVRGPYDDVPVPPGCGVFDFELEVAAVIGRGGRDLSVEEAGGHIAGYLLMNDWSARDIQLDEMEVRLGPVKGKDTATTLGPVLVTPDELAPYRAGNAFDLPMTAAVNGLTVGTDRWSNMAFSYPQMIAYASRGTEVRAGDVLGSGTCGGGCLAELWGRLGLEAHAPLSPGDTVTITVERLGVQRCRVVEGAEPGADDLRASRRT
ncbi:2-keto-4-pentenoate hydratase/2-oxohepta-3-ene-1,7-dioic acid hydratase in catechol pathway [Nonomuraea thailandensis]|uniref:2-keto-4-pentenoate hydratase/2-oxohepta-3-ene-1,7-dioic acid hydratase in catechol pathway n=1 Tax=Nonomuraea thailandensis TaxID=1188745 RepID=A0A9X2GA25_9ACTN|nr:fumarylacetoacetate hydrolase family protein [Nonomuraea thailandensis]MCP2353870.1 2-keto-4-pentenoate hydratase/2-oxohepta-3-ene-1,7-dioic acid hydratase in catechol pathway [Nonomuraea thailandensis]